MITFFIVAILVGLAAIFVVGFLVGFATAAYGDVERHRAELDDPAASWGAP